MRAFLATAFMMASLLACAKPYAEQPEASVLKLEEDNIEQGANIEQPNTVEDFRAESLAAIDKEACAAKGGEIRQEGRLGAWRCVAPYADGGKTCSDDADCEGKCLLPPEAEAATGDTATGACQATDSPFGCYAEIVGGKVAAAICVD